MAKIKRENMSERQIKLLEQCKAWWRSPDGTKAIREAKYPSEMNYEK